MVYDHHREEIALYELVAGDSKWGRLMFAMAILSDVEAMLDGFQAGIGPYFPSELAHLKPEIEEAKELVSDVIRELARG